MTDTERLDWLDKVLKATQGCTSKLFFNDDPHLEDDDGAPLPAGFTFYLEGTCASDLVLTEPSLRELIDMIAAVEEDTADVE